jgi:hexosaminidase
MFFLVILHAKIIIMTRLIFFILIVLSSIICYSSVSLTYSNIIPTPAQSEILDGVFVFSPGTKIFVTDSVLRREAEVFNEFLEKYYGFSLEFTDVIPENNFINLLLINDFEDEAYRLDVLSDKIEILGQPAGVFYALQSFLQMLPPVIPDYAEIHCVKIYDYPRFKWRGMHLDVCRHFFSKEFIFKYLDYMATYRMNVFHWHLTEDQGWRIEIKKYPLLTEKGAWRKGTIIGHGGSADYLIDSIPHGGYYTQEDVREIVDYAAARHITVVPEIEMPGHAMAALYAYPHLSCSGEQKDVATKWGVFEHVFCTKDEVFEFLENVLTEVMELFPGEYIHIGGDECPKTAWKKCPVCQKRIRDEGLKDEYELQSYFIRRIESFINAKGRKLIGWDEILEGGLAPNAAVMSWRGTEGGIEAAKQGHYVVMTPGSHCYFDHYQGNPGNEPLAIGGYTTLEKVYSYEPIPAELSKDEQKFILGAQGNVWTEYMKTEEHVEYMIFPRMLALAEVVWSPSHKRDYGNFRNRVFKHFDYFDKRNINYAKSIFEIKINAVPDTINRKIMCEIIQEIELGDIYYRIDSGDFIKYYFPFLIDSSCVVKAILIGDEGRILYESDQNFEISKTSGAKISLENTPSEKYNYGGAYTLVNGISGMVPWNGIEWTGFLNNNLIAVIDFGQTERISRCEIHSLESPASWIHLPIEIRVYTSRKGKRFRLRRVIDREEIQEQGRIIYADFKPRKARYLKAEVIKKDIIPDGMQGAGHKAWLFVSLISAE